MGNKVLENENTHMQTKPQVPLFWMCILYSTLFHTWWILDSSIYPKSNIILLTIRFLYSGFIHGSIISDTLAFYLNCLGLVVSIYVFDYIPSGGCSSQDFRRIKQYFNPGEGIKIPPEIKLRFNLARQKAKKFNMPSRFVWPKHVSLIGWDFLIVPEFEWKDLHCKICTRQTSAELRISRKWFLSNCHSIKWVILKTQPSLPEAQQTSIRYSQYTKKHLYIYIPFY